MSLIRFAQTYAKIINLVYLRHESLSFTSRNVPHMMYPKAPNLSPLGMLEKKRKTMANNIRSKTMFPINLFTVVNYSTVTELS